MNLKEIKTLIAGSIRLAFTNKKTLDKFNDITGTLKYNGVPVNNLPVFVSDDSPVGSVVYYSGLDVPKDYLTCDGAIYNISDYPLLAHHMLVAFGEINYFGGDGETTFAVPKFSEDVEIFSPNMTSDSAPSPYKTTCNSYYGSGYNPFKAFDNSASTYWCSASGAKNPWVKFDFGAPFSFSGLQITSASDGSTPLSLIIEGSNDDADYKELFLYNTSSWGVSTSRTMEFGKTVKYRFVRITVTKSSGSYKELGEVKFIRTLRKAFIKYQITQNNISKDMVNYSLEEQVIGSWLNGKPLYQKTINCEELPNNSVKNIYCEIENLECITSINGIAQAINSNDFKPLPYNHTEYPIFIDYINNNICISTNSDYSSYTGVITIQYTKTSDAENSFTPEMLSNIKTLNTTASDSEIMQILGGI